MTNLTRKVPSGVELWCSVTKGNTVKQPQIPKGVWVCLTVFPFVTSKVFFII